MLTEVVARPAFGPRRVPIPRRLPPSWACAYNPATSSCTIARRSFLALAFLVAGTIARAFDIVECGQSVHDGQVGDLRADLVCPVNPSVGVYMAAGGTLNLNGYSITGPGTALGGGVQCSGAEGRGACTVNGPGLITNFDIAFVGGGGSLRLQGLAARGNGWGMTYKAPRLIELIDVDMSDNLTYGVSARGGRIVGRNVTANRNGLGGVWGPIEEMVNLTAIGNGVDGGVYAVPFGQRRTPRLVDSTITGNDGLGRGFDVLATLRVKLRNTTCGRAARVRVRRDGGVETTTIRHRLRCTGD